MWIPAQFVPKSIGLEPLSIYISLKVSFFCRFPAILFTSNKHSCKHINTDNWNQYLAGFRRSAGRGMLYRYRTSVLDLYAVSLRNLSSLAHCTACLKTGPPVIFSNNSNKPGPLSTIYGTQDRHEHLHWLALAFFAKCLFFCEMFKTENQLKFFPWQPAQRPVHGKK